MPHRRAALTASSAAALKSRCVRSADVVKRADPFYFSPDWRKLRWARVRVRHDGLDIGRIRAARLAETSRPANEPEAMTSQSCAGARQFSARRPLAVHLGNVRCAKRAAIIGDRIE